MVTHVTAHSSHSSRALQAQINFGPRRTSRYFSSDRSRTQKLNEPSRLSPEGLRNPNLRDRFEAEAQVMAKLEHLGIVRVYDIVYGEQLLFIVMEVVAGGNLWQWVKTRLEKMPERMACDAIIQAATALQAVHDKGIVHRDIKPHNMLLDQNGNIKLTDFEIAQFHQDSEPDKTMTGLVMGTMGYMAPEQMDDSKQATALSDIYSLGACLYSLPRRVQESFMMKATKTRYSLNSLRVCGRSSNTEACCRQSKRSV